MTTNNPDGRVLSPCPLRCIVNRRRRFSEPTNKLAHDEPGKCGAIAALGTLRSINGRLTHTSQQMSLGLRVATASDNAAYWSISTSMRSDVKAMNAVNDSVGLAQGVVDTAYAGMENVLESFVEIRNLVITASDMPQPGFKDVVKPTFSLDPEYAKSDVYKIDQRIQQLQQCCPRRSRA
ncbi:hypothetical protein [Rhizobium leguminosarum]|uniref:flagellin N-terminal helical domain-containing protein n=1 Tax=Rhizobium leguminosarum TaxID=384 RepID=UPI001C988A63|nr:hypothetical protein [Rhizobium leguminosarum]